MNKTAEVDCEGALLEQLVIQMKNLQKERVILVEYISTKSMQ